MREVMGVGYEGQDVEVFIDRLVALETATLVDVRLTPLSRKRGFSKTGLSAALASRGIAYVHFSELGNPRENRPGYREVESETGTFARSVFVNLLKSEAPSARIDEIIDLSENGLVVLLCFERDERLCHRHEVLAAVEARTSDLVEA